MCLNVLFYFIICFPIGTHLSTFSWALTIYLGRDGWLVGWSVGRQAGRQAGISD